MIVKRMTLVVQKRCSMCMGCGRMTRRNNGIWMPADMAAPNDPEVKTCDKCKGEGWIPVDDLRLKFMVIEEDDAEQNTTSIKGTDGLAGSSS